MREPGGRRIAVGCALLCALLACSGKPQLRAVSLSPAITQLAAKLDLSDAVVPIDPRAPDALSRAIASGAQLALSDGGPESADVRALFASRNVAVRVFAPQTTDEVFAAYREVASLLGDADAGDDLAERVSEDLEKAAAASAGGERPKVALILQLSPLRVVTGDAFLSKLLAAAGADNAFGDLSTASVAIRPELLRERAPALRLEVPADLARNAWVDPSGTIVRLRELVAGGAR